MDNQKSLKLLVSKLFVEANKEVDKFNGSQCVVTYSLKKFLDCGNKSFYSSGQRKIKSEKYEKGLPKFHIAEDLMKRVVNKSLAEAAIVKRQRQKRDC